MKVQLKPSRELYHNGVATRCDRAAATRSGPFFVAAGAALAVASLGLGYRREIAAAVPFARPVFARLGLTTPETGPTLESIRSRLEATPTPFLAITGKIADYGRGGMRVPRLRVSIRAQDGREIYHWIADPPKKTLRAGESIKFKASLADPPTNGRAVVVGFVP